MIVESDTMGELRVEHRQKRCGQTLRTFTPGPRGGDALRAAHP